MNFGDLAEKLVNLAEKEPAKYSDCLQFGEGKCVNSYLLALPGLQKGLPKVVLFPFFVPFFNVFQISLLFRSGFY